MKVRLTTLFSGYDSQALAMERLKRNFPEFDYDLVAWCELEREYIAMISEKHFTEHFKNYGNNEKENNFQRQAQGQGRVDIR